MRAREDRAPGALLGAAGCVSIGAGVEIVTEHGRATLDKRCRMSNEDLAEQLILAKRHVPFVQASLLEVANDDQDLLDAGAIGCAARGSGPTTRCRCSSSWARSRPGPG